MKKKTLPVGAALFAEREDGWQVGQRTEGGRWFIWRISNLTGGIEYIRSKGGRISTFATADGAGRFMASRL